VLLFGGDELLNRSKFPNRLSANLLVLCASALATFNAEAHRDGKNEHD